MKHSATGIIRQGDQTRSVTLRRNAEGIELVYHHTTPTRTPGVPATGGDLIVGVDAGAVAFHHVTVPAVKGDDMPAVVRMQAEALSPLAIDDMTFAWHAGVGSDGQLPVTIATAKTDHLQQVIRQYEHLHPARFLLEGQAAVKVWRLLCPGAEGLAVIINFTANGTLLCLAEPTGLAGGSYQLIHQTTLDVTLDDLRVAEGAGVNRQRLIVDLLGALKLFGVSGQETPAVFILAPGDGAVSDLAQALNDRGLETKIVMAMPGNLSTGRDFSQADLFEYLIPVGLALLGLDEDAMALDLFAELGQPDRETSKDRQRRSLKKKVALVVGLVVVGVVVAYVSDIMQLGRLEKAWQQGGDELSAVELIEQHRLRKNIARQRIDMLELMSRVQAALPDGMLVDRVTFKRGRRMSLEVSTKNIDQVYEFQKALTEQKGIKAVKPSVAIDRKKATVTFDYKTFTTKRGGR